MFKVTYITPGRKGNPETTSGNYLDARYVPATDCPVSGFGGRYVLPPNLANQKHHYNASHSYPFQSVTN